MKVTNETIWKLVEIEEVKEGDVVKLNYARPADREPRDGEYVVNGMLVTPNRVGQADKDAWQAKKSKDGPGIWTLLVQLSDESYRTFLGSRIVDENGNPTTAVEIQA